MGLTLRQVIPVNVATALGFNAAGATGALTTKKGFGAGATNCGNGGGFMLVAENTEVGHQEGEHFRMRFAPARVACEGPFFACENVRVTCEISWLSCEMWTVACESAFSACE